MKALIDLIWTMDVNMFLEKTAICSIIGYVFWYIHGEIQIMRARRIAKKGLR